MNIVQVGDLWEADGRVFWILGLRSSMFLEYTIYEYFEITCEEQCIQKGHLTIQREDLFRHTPNIWKKLA